MISAPPNSAREGEEWEMTGPRGRMGGEKGSWLDKGADCMGRSSAEERRREWKDAMSFLDLPEGRAMGGRPRDEALSEGKDMGEEGESEWWFRRGQRRKKKTASHPVPCSRTIQNVQRSRMKGQREAAPFAGLVRVEAHCHRQDPSATPGHDH